MAHDTSDPTEHPIADVLRARLAAAFSSRPWLCATHVVPSAVSIGKFLLEAGAEDVFGLGVAPGAGDLDVAFPVLALDQRIDGSMMDVIRGAAEALADLPAETVEQVDAWDPMRRAGVIGTITDVAGMVAGRRRFGARPLAWVELEDKIAVRNIWTQAGINVAPSEVVALTDADALVAAHARVATDDASVWAGDDRTGWHGGASSTRWVPTHDSIETIAGELRTRHDHVRIMPFVEGVPCSIHGFVLPTGIAVFRPAEMVVLRNPTTHKFVYAKAAHFWDPAKIDRDAMRDAARAVGDVLAAHHGFRGVFTLDGIMGRDGFVPTEINPRYGGALPMALESVDPPLNLYLLNLLAVEGLLDDIDAADFEAFVLADLDGTRRGGLLCETEAAPGEEQTAAVIAHHAHENLRIEDGVTDAADATIGDGEYVLAVVRWGDAANGGILVGRYGPDVPIGPSIGPSVSLALARLSDHWNIDLPALEAARVVR